jgi:hypothetical protein
MPEGWLRRQAVQIAAQLPEDPQDALAVLELAKTLVETFLLTAQPTRERGEVLPFSAASSSR